MQLTGHEGGITTAKFSQDQRFLATGGRDKGVRLWKLTDSSLNVAPLRLTEEVDKYGSRPESRWLATKGPDHTVIVSDLKAPDPSANPTVLRGHQDDVRHIAVSPNDRWLATSSADGTVRLWDLNATNPSANARILRESASQMDFTADNRWLLTISSMEKPTTIHLWDVSATDPSLNSKTWSRDDYDYQQTYLTPDNHWLFDFGNHRSWDVAGLDFSSINLREGSVTISPDGAWIITSENGATKLRRLKKGEITHAYELKDVSAPFVFSPDDRWLLTGPTSQPSLWDLNADNPAAAPRRLSSEVDVAINQAVFSPDSKWVAVGGSHDTVLLWNLREVNPKPFVLKASEGLGNATVNDLDISSDSRWLMVSTAANLRIWDLTATNPAAVPVTLPIPGFSDAARFTRYDPHRQWLLIRTIGPDSAAATVLWNMQTRELAEQACRAAGRNLSPNEWKEYFPDRPYARTCPNLPAEN
jgi:WD40 repeat protein